MAKPPAGHGYIDFVGDEEDFWTIETPDRITRRTTRDADPDD